MPRPPEFRRFLPGDIVEHWLMTVSFTMLAVTGLPQMFAGRPTAEWVITFIGGIEMVRILHHLFGVMLVVLTILHVVRVGYKLVVRRVGASMLPRLSDIREFLGWLRYSLGLAKTRPAFDRYSFEHKIEYWALIWGTLLMIVTGFVLLVPIKATAFLPGEIVPAAKAAHGYEAVLAVLSVAIWHFYNVHIRVWNRSMFSGRLTEHEMREEHPREFDGMSEGGQERESREMDKGYRIRKRLYLSFATVFVFACLAGTKVLLTEDTSVAAVPPGQVTSYAPAVQPVVAPRLPDTGAAAKDGAPAIPHATEGRGECLTCHARPGGVKPVPESHSGRANATCTACHHGAG